MKAPIYLHDPDGNVTEISIQEGVEIVNKAAAKGYTIDGVSEKSAGEAIVTADDMVIKFPVHYADALTILFEARMPPKPGQLLRVRFYASDSRPINWPVKHPCWETGCTMDDRVIVVSYADDVNYIYQNWPDAHDLDVCGVDGYQFTDRFQKPDNL